MTYLLDTWYCAGWSHEYAEKPVGRTLLDKPIVFYRDSTGTLNALDGACPHRFAPMTQGVILAITSCALIMAFSSIRAAHVS